MTRYGTFYKIPGWSETGKQDTVNLMPLVGTLLHEQWQICQQGNGMLMNCEVCGDLLQPEDIILINHTAHASHFFELFVVETRPEAQRDSREVVDYHALAHVPIPSSLPLVERLDLPQRRGFSSMVFQMVCGVYLALLRLRWSIGRGSR